MVSSLTLKSLVEISATARESRLPLLLTALLRGMRSRGRAQP